MPRRRSRDYRNSETAFRLHFLHGLPPRYIQIHEFDRNKINPELIKINYEFKISAYYNDESLISVAKIIMAAASKHLTPVALELGGKWWGFIFFRKKNLKDLSFHFQIEFLKHNNIYIYNFLVESPVKSEK